MSEVGEKIKALLKQSNAMSVMELETTARDLSSLISERRAWEKSNIEVYDKFKIDIDEERKSLKTLEGADPQRLKKARDVCQEIARARKELVAFFSSNGTGVICGECKGRCCGHFCGGRLDVVYLAILDYALPELEKCPNVFDVRPHHGNKCPFLNKNGCSLGENKPFICITYVCYSEWEHKLERKLFEEVEAKRSIMGNLHYNKLSDLLGIR